MPDNYYKYHPLTNKICKELKEGLKGKRQLKGLSGSSRALFFVACFEKIRGKHLVIFPDKESAAYFSNDLANSGLDEYLLFFPSSYKRSILYGQTDESGVIMRTKTLEKLGSRVADIIIVSYPEALTEKVISPGNLHEHSFQVKKGEKIGMEFLEEILRTYGFTRNDFVYDPGQYAIRGSIIDVFSFSSARPFRIDFTGNLIDSIRVFDVDTQLSVNMEDSIHIIPDIQLEHRKDEKRSSLVEYFSEPLIWAEDLSYITRQMNDLYASFYSSERSNRSFSSVQEALISPGEEKHISLSDGNELNTCIELHNIIEFSNQPGTYLNQFVFNTIPQIPVNKNFKLLAEIFRDNTSKGYRNIVLSENEKQIRRIQDIFNETDPDIRFETVLSILHEGFTDHELGISIFTDHQIFDRYHKFRLKDQFVRKESLALKELTNLNPGDYVVHVDHGIGVFGGLETIEINGRKQETVRLVYKDNDVLYVSIHSLHRISRFKSGDGESPRIYKLGTGAWQKLKQTTRKKIKDIAQELIALYAQRMQEKGFSFSPDTYLQRELEASFIYEDTPDQIKATVDIKAGMEAEYPMDRLVCGDVGFGKTEIAIRAAFKAVADSKQVAVLVPTTLLAFQHYNTFSERLKEFPCNIDYITRLRKPADNKQILQHLETGKVDIVIGTHKLLAKNIKFKDIGLLIIDEEQKFGVAMKEKLRQLKMNIDTLTLTATPIPRTLQFSLMGARDLSVINTPPPNRHPIVTESHTFNEDIIREAIEYELSRGGQVFFIHNRVQNIYDIEKTINRLITGARTAVAHGQMEGNKLEDTMLHFVLGDYDVLVATTIIESGLDIPNANTIIINNAHHFGLSDLHQLRGRVGRSNKKAFCYLLSPPHYLITHEARRRLKAIEENSDLGSGFSIAMQDLDIRGAGNLLGAEQSGFIAEIGLETYQRILHEAMLELKENEFGYLFKNQNETDGTKQYTTDCQIDTDFQVLFPDTYISNTAERMNLYRELDNITDEKELSAFTDRLNDRFGKIPQETMDLMNIVRIRKMALNLGFEKIVIKKNQMLIYFIQNQDSAYFNSETFKNILAWVKGNPSNVKMKDEGSKLTMKIGKIACIDDALKILQDFNQ